MASSNSAPSVPQSLRVLALSFMLAQATPVDIPANFNPISFSVQPNNGGGTADDCGGGPVTLDADTWNAQGMDQVVQSFFDSKSSDPNFDFHQAFADQYGVDLFCSNTFTNCEGDPSSCSALKGTTQQKTQGWLGIKAIMTVQDQFLQWEKVTSNVIDTISGFAVDFQGRFAPSQNTAATPGGKFGRSVPGILLGGLSAVLSVGGLGLAATPLGAAFAAGASLVASTIGSSISDSYDAAADPELRVTDISDSMVKFKQNLLVGIDQAHNATFSNGFAGSFAGPKMPDLLKGGVYSGTTVPQAYENAENSLQSLLERFMAAKLLETTWRDGYNTFMIYVPNVIGDCAKWHGNTGSKDVLRYCGSTGMFLLHNIDPTSKAWGSPHGATNEDVAWIGGYNMKLQDLMASAASIYLGHGLTSTDEGYFFPGIVDAWRGSNPDSAIQQPGFFTLPVCELQYYNWKQSDNAGTTSPPCDCLTAQDQWGDKFMDVATQDVKNWIQAKCK